MIGIGKRKAGFAFASVGVLALLTACGGGQSASVPSSAAASAAASSAAESAPAAEGQELKLWHYEAPDSAMGKAWAKAIEVFEAENPGVTVKFEPQSFEALRANAKVILTGNEVPDVMEFNKGSDTGQLAAQGLITPLTEQVTSYGWDQKLSSPSVQVLAKYNEQGVPGSGEWFGVPNYGEYILAYYNKDYFAKNGLEVPKTRAEFNDLLEKIKASGTTPICAAAKDFPYIHSWFQGVLAKAPADWVNSYQLFKGPVDFSAPYWTEGTAEAQKWASEYSTPNLTGVSHEDMGTNFIAEKCPIMITGSWWFGRLASNAKFDWGTFVMPEQNLNQGSTGNLWTIPTNSANKELAAKFIDITLRPEIQGILDQAGGLSLAGNPDSITDERTKKFTQDFQKLVAENKLALYPDFPVPGFYEVMLGLSQGVAQGEKSPEEIVKGVADFYNEGRAAIESGQ